MNSCKLRHRFTHVSRRRISTTVSVLLVAVSATSCSSILRTTAQRASAAGVDCRAIEGLLTHAAPGRVLIFGETHGTLQAPAFIGDAVCMIAQSGRPVVLGLEIPGAEQARIDVFVASRGTAVDRSALLVGKFWRGLGDGRTSEAMVGLLDRIRRLRVAGQQVSVVAFDASAADSIDVKQRDALMGTRLHARWRSMPDAVHIVLAGSVHARLQDGTPWDSTFRPMARFMAERLGAPRVVAFRLAHRGGTAWQCREDATTSNGMSCRTFPVSPNSELPAWVVRASSAQSTDAPDEGWTGHWGVGAVTASPPAVPPAPAEMAPPGEVSLARGGNHPGLAKAHR